MQQIGAFGDKVLAPLWDLVPVEQNYAFSSLALYLALSDFCLGAAGKSYEELRALLNLTGKDELARLRPVVNRLLASGVFTINNKVIVGADIPLNPSFEREVREHAEIVVGGPPDVMDLISHLSLNAAWKHKFDPKKTVRATFTRLDGSSFEVDMMNQNRELPYGHDNNFEWVVLGHQSKQEREQAPVLMLFLPQKGVNFEQAGKMLTQERIEKAYKKTDDSEKVELALPKIFFERVVAAAGVFETSTLQHCFSTNADFSAASDVPMRIKEIQIGVMQEWDEEGQKVEMFAKVRGATLGIHEDIELAFNRPFYEVLYDPATKLVLLQGRIVEPPRAGSQNPGRLSHEFKELLGTQAPTITSDRELRLLLSYRLLDSMPGTGKILHFEMEKIRKALLAQLESCDSKTLLQIYGFINGPLADALSEYLGRMVQVVHTLERWKRMQDLRIALCEQNNEYPYTASDLKELLQLLLSKPSYPKPPEFDASGDLVDRLERLLALSNPLPSLLEQQMVLLSLNSKAACDATLDAMYCAPSDELLAQLSSYQEESDPATLIALFRQPEVSSWIEGRTKHYMQEVRYNLAVLFEPPAPMRKSYEETMGKKLDLYKLAKLSPHYFCAQVIGPVRYTYEFGFRAAVGDWNNILNPHTLALRPSLGESNELFFAFSEQYSLAGEPNGNYKRRLLKQVIAESMVFNIPFPMQQFLRNVWPNSQAGTQLLELCASLHKAIEQAPR